MDRVAVSVSKICDRMAVLGMNMTELSQTANTNMWVIVKSGRTTRTTAGAIAEALRLKSSDIITGVPEEAQVLKNVVFGPECYETKPCFGRSEEGRCQILREGYDKGMKCPFTKEKRSK